MDFDPSTATLAPNDVPASFGFDPTSAKLWEPDEKPKKTATFDHESAVPESALRHIVSAGLTGYKEGFEGTPPILSPEIQAALDRVQEKGGIKGYLAGLASTAADDVHAPLAVGPGLFRAGQAMVAQAGEEAGQPQLGRDIAAMPEAFMGAPGMLRTPEAPPPGGFARPRAEPGFRDAPAPSPAAPTASPVLAGPTRTVPPEAPPAARSSPPEPARPLAIEGPKTATSDPWAAVAEAPADQPHAETPIAGPNVAGEPAAELAPRDDQPEDRPAFTAPSPEQLEQWRKDFIAGYGGPWSPVGLNSGSEQVYENGNGVRAIMVDGVAYTEPVTETAKGLEPKNVAKRKPQFQVMSPAGESESKSPRKRVENESGPGEAPIEATPVPSSVKAKKEPLSAAMPTIKGFHATSDPFTDFDWNRLGSETERNITDADDPLSFGMALAKLGPWAHENAIAGKLVRTHDLPVEIGGKGKNYPSLEALHKAIVRAGGAGALRNSLVSRGFGHIKVKDEEFGGVSYVGLAPEHFSIAVTKNTH